MKYFAVIFAICIASTFAASLTDSRKAKLKEFKAACIAETGVNLEAVENAKKDIIDETDPKFACFVACYFKKAGFINAQDAFDEAGFRAHVPDVLPKEKVDAIVDKCSAQTGANVCETAVKLLKCYLENKTPSILVS